MARKGKKKIANTSGGGKVQRPRPTGHNPNTPTTGIVKAPGK